MIWSNIPNLITLGRFIVVVPMVYFLIDKSYGAALLLFIFAGVSDGLDGYLAKRYHWESRLGSILDPLADKALLVSCYAVLAWQEHIAIWLVIFIVIRDLLIISGATAYHFIYGYVEMRPSIISKINTFFQITLVVVVLFNLAIFESLVVVKNILIYVVGFTTLYSGSEYVYTWGKLALQQKGQSNGR